jgi:hypothetical protein
MKKTYIKPIVEIDDLNMQELMKASIPFGDPVDNGSDAEARGGRFSTWEDEVED